MVKDGAAARAGGLILHTTVGIGYETPWRQVEAMLLIAAERMSGMLREPQPFVRQKSLGDFCIVYELNAYTADAGAMPGATPTCTEIFSTCSTSPVCRS